MAKAPYILCFGPFELDGEELRRNGSRVALAPLPFAVLVFLVTRHDRVVLKSELLNAFWPASRERGPNGRRPSSEGSLAVAIASVRTALNDADREPPWIETHPGKGYRFAAEPTRVDPGQPAVVVETQGSSASTLDVLDLAEKIGRWRYIVCATDPEFPRYTHRVRLERIQDRGVRPFRARLQHRSGLNPCSIDAESLGVLSSHLVAEVERSARAHALEDFGRIPCAWSDALAGVEHMHRYSRKENEHARELLSRALSSNPDHAHALIHFAIASNFAHALGWYDSADHAAELVQQVKASAERVANLDRRNPMAKVAFGLARRREQMTGDQTAFQAAIHLNEDLGLAHVLLADCLLHAGDTSEALQSVERGESLLQRDSFLWWARTTKSAVLFARGDFSGALANADSAAHEVPHHLMLYALRIASLAHLDRIQEARRVLADSRQHWPQMDLELARKMLTLGTAEYRELLLEGLQKAWFEQRPAS